MVSKGQCQAIATIAQLTAKPFEPRSWSPGELDGFAIRNYPLSLSRWQGSGLMILISSGVTRA